MSSPIWASSLLTTADRLARGQGNAGRPPLADLRRATSTAYYALFHQVLRHASLNAVSGATEADVANVARWFSHAGVAKASRWVLVANSPRQPKKEDVAAVRLLRSNINHPGYPLPAQLVRVAQSFVDLQGVRHEADYSNDYDPIRYTTIDHVKTADAAVRDTWSMWRARSSPKATRLAVGESYERYLMLCLAASGGPQTR